jgi:hypothetical protein
MAGNGPMAGLTAKTSGPGLGALGGWHPVDAGGAAGGICLLMAHPGFTFQDDVGAGPGAADEHLPVGWGFPAGPAHR